ncbi:TonB-dependent receptor [Vibrio sonorensis]|uniref:TonB-dependent receptor n=1 Tax=Vibrio sonorensis TaxID=1004316 RepID=UPI0009FF637C|nr:TonB-dependent receptor [Vibrio sonorensis]
MNAKKSCIAIAVASFLSCSYSYASETAVFYHEPTVVTAQKFSEEEQKTPISTTIITDEQLERSGAENTYDVINSAPNVTMIKAGNPSDAGFMSMRGITPTMEGSQTVLFLVDGVPYHMFDMELLDADRVEILRGPQGTLYGRNASSGVISVVTKDPSFEREGKLIAGMGNYNESKAGFISGGAIGDSETWAYRAALQYRHGDGYWTRASDGKEDIDDIDEFNGRIKLGWMPLDSDWHVITTFEAHHRDNGDTSFASLQQIERDSHKVYSDFEGRVDADVYSGSIKAVYEGESINFESITAYTEEDKEDDLDSDFSAYPVAVLYMDVEHERFTQEFRFSSNTEDDLRWLAGLYYFDERASNDIKMDMQVPTPMGMFPLTNHKVSETDTRNIALFGNVFYSITPEWELMAGLRIDYEESDFTFNNQWSALNPSVSGSQDVDQTELLPKVGVNYYPNDDLMFYGSIARGYKSGGFNMLTPPGYPTEFESEFTLNYEVGMKSDWLDNRLKFNTALFWIDWDNQQVEQQIYPESFTENAGSTVSRGIEAELSWFVTPEFRLFASGGYNDAHFTDYTSRTFDPSGNLTGTADMSGKRPASAPRYDYSVGFDLNFWENYFFYADYNVLGKMYFDVANTQEQDDYGVLNLRTGYTSDNVDVTLWAKNVLDEEYITRAFAMSNNWYGRSGEPVTFGLTTSLKW